MREKLLQNYFESITDSMKRKRYVSSAYPMRQRREAHTGYFEKQ